MKKFLPLILVLSGIVTVTLGWQWHEGYSGPMEFMRGFMAFFFLSFGFFKLLDWSGFVMAYQEYDIVAKRIMAYAWLYPLIELGLGISYLTNWNPFWTNVVTAVVMGVSSIGVILALRTKRKFQCACLGTVVKLPMTTVTVIEDVGMGLMALLMLAW